MRAAYDYYPYGLPWDRVGSPYDETMAGTEFQSGEWGLEGLDLNYFAARYYDPILGRWHAPDPLEQCHSPYLAMLGDPANFIDPDGRAGIPFLQDFMKSDGGTFLLNLAGQAAFLGAMLSPFSAVGGTVSNIVSVASSLYSASSSVATLAEFSGDAIVDQCAHANPGEDQYSGTAIELSAEGCAGIRDIGPLSESTTIFDQELCFDLSEILDEAMKSPTILSLMGIAEVNRDNAEKIIELISEGYSSTNCRNGKILLNNHRDISAIVKALAHELTNRKNYKSYRAIHAQLFKFEITPYSFAEMTLEIEKESCAYQIMVAKELGYSFGGSWQLILEQYSSGDLKTMDDLKNSFISSELRTVDGLSVLEYYTNNAERLQEDAKKILKANIDFMGESQGTKRYMEIIDSTYELNKPIIK